MSQASSDGTVSTLDTSINTKSTGSVKTNTAVKLLLLILVLAVLALAAGGAFLYEQQRSGNKTSQEIVRQVQLDQQNIKASLEQINQRFVSQQSTQQQNLSELQQRIESLQSLQAEQAQQLQRMSTTDRSDWKLAEAEYLLRLANHRLLMAKETAGAAALLQAADNIVRDLDDMGLFKVREAIGVDLAALRAVPQVDITGAYSRIYGLAKQVDTLPLLINGQQTTRFDDLPTTVDANASFLTRSWQNIQNAWKKMQEVLSIRSYDYASEPLLPPQQHFYLRQNLKLQFDQAQAALLSRNDALFKLSLSNASEWINRYYQREAPAVKAILDALEELQQISLQQNLPDISGSLLALQNFQKTRHDIKTKQPNRTEAASRPDGSPVL